MPANPRPELHTPETDALREHLEEEAQRLSEEFGQGPVHKFPESWVWRRGDWTLSTAWLLYLGDRQENRGFRVTLVNGVTQVTQFEIWWGSYRLTFQHPGIITAERVSQMINAAFWLRPSHSEIDVTRISPLFVTEPAIIGITWVIENEELVARMPADVYVSHVELYNGPDYDREPLAIAEIRRPVAKDAELRIPLKLGI